jgi:hypothetical protein
MVENFLTVRLTSSLRGEKPTVPRRIHCLGISNSSLANFGVIVDMPLLFSHFYIRNYLITGKLPQY